MLRSALLGWPDLNIWRAIEADPTEAARAALSFMKRVFS